MINFVSRVTGVRGIKTIKNINEYKYMLLNNRKIIMVPRWFYSIYKIHIYFKHRINYLKTHISYVFIGTISGPQAIHY